MISSLLQASELVRQLGDPGRRVLDGLHGAVVRGLDRRGPEPPIFLCRFRSSASARRASSGETTTAGDPLAKIPGFSDHVASASSASEAPQRPQLCRTPAGPLAWSAARSSSTSKTALEPLRHALLLVLPDQVVAKSIGWSVMPHRPSGRTGTSA